MLKNHIRLTKVFKSHTFCAAQLRSFLVHCALRIPSLFLLLSQALHKISLRENVCTVRVCEVLLSLTSTLIDLGVLANNTKALLLSSLVKPDNNTNPPEMPTAPPPPSSANDTNKATNAEQKETNNEPASSPAAASEFSLHNIFMDIVIRYMFFIIIRVYYLKQRREFLFI